MKIKTSNHIINELSNFSHYKPLKALFYYKEFLSYFPKNHQQMISKLFIKNDTLIILAKHHIGYIELNHDNTKKMIKSLIKTYVLAKPMSNFIKVKNIRILSDRNYIIQKNVSKKNKNFIELSEAKFKNDIENPFLYNKFEELREIIKNARSRT
ncbi:hypothetical protein [Campylobacter armoricus]|uniref:DUF721 domain-containing protein n=2 Tax=Campylobacter armoricus TaxID=2505970 RepID=A0A7L5HZZ0_9BACT|nr:hypothetical protein [Campylobacter armoricus]QKF79431.1 hypothetical protein CARM_0496 [Campylobacter armoricus]